MIQNMKRKNKFGSYEIIMAYYSPVGESLGHFGLSGQKHREILSLMVVFQKTPEVIYKKKIN